MIEETNPKRISHLGGINITCRCYKCKNIFIKDKKYITNSHSRKICPNCRKPHQPQKGVIQQ